MSARWNEIVEEIFGRGFEIEFPRFFHSKKNQVTLLNLKRGDEKLPVVAKFFVWGEPGREWKILNDLQAAQIAAPRPLKFYKNIIFMEFIPGKDLRMIVNREPSRLDPRLPARWLAKLHREFKRANGFTLLKGDTMLPNFVVHEKTGKLYGIDFEESEFGNPMKDLGNLLVSMLLLPGSDANLNYPQAAKFLQAYLKVNPVSIDPVELKKSITGDMHLRCSFSPHKKGEFQELIDSINMEMILYNNSN